MASLKGRLSRLRTLGLVKAAELPIRVPAADKPSRESMAGWERLAPHVFARTVETGFILGVEEDGHCERLNLDWRRPEADGGTVDIGGIVFFDLETTGLSGGTGTIAFLAAAGYFEGRNFTVRQIFLDDFPGEPDFLASLLETLSRFDVVATFNGAAFDMPLLRTRCIMNAVPLPGFDHIDVLRPSRRLWGRVLESCALQHLEREILGESRIGDIPGSLIPRIWLDFNARRGEAPPALLDMIRRVAEHNAKDVLSLARMTLIIDTIIKKPREIHIIRPPCPAALAEELLRRGRTAEGVELLEKSAAAGGQRSLLMLARYYKRLGMMTEYGRIVGAMSADDWRSCVEKAKYFEHVARDYHGALVHAVRARELWGGEAKAEVSAVLDRRLARLKRKLEEYGKQDAQLPGDSGAPACRVSPS